MGVVSLVGVLEVGGPRDADLVPSNPRTTLRYTRGSTLTVSLTILGSQGVPVDLTAAALPTPTTTVEFVVKTSSIAEENTLSMLGAVVGDPRLGVVEFAVPVAAFRYSDPGRYVYDVWLLTATTRDAVVPTSPFVVEPSLRAIS